MEKRSDKDPELKGSRMQQEAIGIEFKLRNELRCERFGLGGFVNSDHIRSGGFISAIILILSKYYNDGNKAIIDEYINDILFYSGERMDDIDEDVVDDIIERFKKISKKIGSNF